MVNKILRDPVTVALLSMTQQCYGEGVFIIDMDE